MPNTTESRPEPSRTLVVLAPDVVGRGFNDGACARVLVAWRDGRLMPALNRQLLQVYLQVLQKLGLGDALLRRWGWWFTAADRVRFLEQAVFPAANGRELCAAVAKAAGAACVIALAVPASPNPQGAGDESAQAPVPWITPETFGLKGCPQNW